MTKFLTSICFVLLSMVCIAQVEKLEIEGAIQIGNHEDPSPDEGTIRWTGTDFEGFNGTDWTSLTSFISVTDILEWSPSTDITVAANDAIAYLVNTPGAGILTIPHNPAGTPWLSSGIEVPEGIMVLGFNTEIQLAQSNDNGAIFKVTGDNSSIQGFHLTSGFIPPTDGATNSFNNYGIRVDGADEIKLLDNHIVGFDHGGIALFNSSNSQISRNTIIDNGYAWVGAGIWIFGSSAVNVTDNTVSSTRGGYGIIIDDGSTSPGPADGPANHNIIHTNRVTIKRFVNSGGIETGGIGVLVEAGRSNQVSDNYIMTEFIGIQVNTGAGTPAGAWGPTQLTQIDGNQIEAGNSGLLGVQADKGADSTVIMNNTITGWTIGIRYQGGTQAVASAGQNVNGVITLGADAAVNNVMIRNGTSVIDASGAAITTPNTTL